MKIKNRGTILRYTQNIVVKNGKFKQEEIDVDIITGEVKKDNFEIGTIIGR